MRFLTNIFLFFIILGILLVPLFTFIVQESQTAIRLRLGEVTETDIKPGLHFALPFYHKIRILDARILSFETLQPERFLIQEGKAMMVDYFVKWRIQDTDVYYRSTQGGDELRARNRLEQIIKDGMQVAFSQRTLNEAISSQRDEIMEFVKKTANEKAKEFGIKIEDVRVKRIDLPIEVSSSVFRRMEKEREVAAQTFRAEGEKIAKRIRAEAERERDEILARANREAEFIRGEGDAIAAKTYAEAYGKNPEFYKFYRSLTAYTNVFNKSSDIMILAPDSEFFRYLKQNPTEGFVVDPEELAEVEALIAQMIEAQKAMETVEETEPEVTTEKATTVEPEITTEKAIEVITEETTTVEPEVITTEEENLPEATLDTTP